MVYKYIGQEFVKWPQSISYKYLFNTTDMTEQESCAILTRASKILETTLRSARYQIDPYDPIDEEYMMAQTFCELAGMHRYACKIQSFNLSEVSKEYNRNIKLLEDKLADEYDRGYEDGVKMHHALNDP